MNGGVENACSSEKEKTADFTLTKVTIDQAKSEAQTYVLADTRNGLYLRVHPSWLKKWVIRTRIGGVEARRTIGRYRSMSLNDVLFTP